MELFFVFIIVLRRHWKKIAFFMKERINYPPKLFTEKGKRFMKELNNRRIEGYLNILSTIEEEIKKLNLEIKEHCRSIKETVLLTTIPGIDYYSALLIYTEIGDINRFLSAKKFCSYAGLVPSVRQSGDKAIVGKITKNGNSLLRWILVQCAFTAVRVAPYFKAFYERIKTKSCSQKAVVATARKLLTIICAILKQNKPYIYLLYVYPHGKDCTAAEEWVIQTFHLMEPAVQDWGLSPYRTTR